LTSGRILRLYTPLALSWLMMAVESPISVAIISRLPNARIDTAAFLVLMSVSLWIESPVIDLLATSTTLALDPTRILLLRRFTLWLMLLSCAVHALVALTPLFDWLAYRVLGLDAVVGEALRVPLAIMIPWSACIGWRRFLQGVLIRHHRTRLISVGTALRVATIAIVGFSLAAAGSLPGVQIVALGLVASVFVEAVFVHWVSRETLRSVGSFTEVGGKEESSPRLSLRRLIAFHAPLTATTLVLLSASPIVSAALARAPDAILAMAGFQVSLTLLWMLRTIVFALPEVVITLYRDAESARVLRRFCIVIGAWCTVAMLVVTLSGFDRWFFIHVLATDEPTAATAHVALLASALLPLIGALQSYVRGVLTVHHMTVARLSAVAVGLVTLGLALWIGVTAEWPGVISSAIAVTVSLAAELWVLVEAWRRRPKLQPA